MDFCLLFSSNASVLGGLGFIAYSAANTFMDAFASSRSSASQSPSSATWISATWDPWPEETKRYTGYQTSMDQYTMTAEESVEAFSRVVMSAPEGQVVVSTGDLLGRLDLWVNRNTSKGDPQSLEAPLIQARPNIGSIYVAPRNDVEQAIAGIWQQIMGIEQIGIYDNFFELGGHSLLATRVMSQVRDTLRAELPLRALFETPNIAGLAASITEMQDDAPDDMDEAGVPDHLLSKIELLSDEEAASLLLK